MRFLLTIIMLVTSTLVVANESAKTVIAYWGFPAGTPQGIMARIATESANRQQTKYKFVFTPKPGAGTSIAANSLRTSMDLAILFSTSSFFVRPLLYKDSHNVENFSMVATTCLGQPLTILSKKKKSITEGPVSIGIISGSIVQLLPKVLSKENPYVRFTEIPYKGTVDATTDMIGGHIDSSVDFIGKQTLSRLDNSVNILGITGIKNHGPYRTFTSQKLVGTEELVVDYFIHVDNGVGIELRKELHTIFTNAIRDKEYRAACEDDFGSTVSIPFDQVNQMNERQKNKWRKLTEGIPKE